MGWDSSSGTFLLRLRKKNIAVPMAINPRAAAPTAMPIVAPVDKPPPSLSFPLLLSLSLEFVSVDVAVADDDVEDAVEVPLDAVLVVEVEPFVVVLVVSSPFAAARKSLWLTVIGVLETVQACSMVSYTFCTSLLSFCPRHRAAFVMKLPPLPHKHSFIACALSPVHFDAVEASFRHDCEFVG